MTTRETGTERAIRNKIEALELDSELFKLLDNERKLKDESYP